MVDASLVHQETFGVLREIGRKFRDKSNVINVIIHNSYSPELPPVTIAVLPAI